MIPLFCPRASPPVSKMCSLSGFLHIVAFLGPLPINFALNADGIEGAGNDEIISPDTNKIKNTRHHCNLPIIKGFKPIGDA